MKRRYLRARLLLAPLTWLAVSAITFLFLQFTPGGPLETQLAEWRAEGTTGTGIDTAETRRALIQTYGFDRPLPRRYWHWLTAGLRGDWGTSFRYQRPVANLIAPRAALTLRLAIGSLFLAYAFGIPLGAWLAARRRRLAAGIVSTLLLVLHSLPAFLIALALIRACGFSNGVFLPALTYASAALTGVAFLTRGAFVDEQSRAYVRALEARGLSEWRIFRHLLPRACSPLLAGFPQTLTWFAAGSVLVETVFDLPGLGRLSYEASLARDYPVLLAILGLLAAAQIASQLVCDLLLAWADPRLRFDRVPA